MLLLFLLQLLEKQDESDVAVQTDYFLYRPDTVACYPSKKSVDAGTQIEPSDVSRHIDNYFIL